MRKLLIIGAALGMAVALSACNTRAGTDPPLAFAAAPAAPLDTGQAAIRECLAQAVAAHTRTVQAGAPDSGRGMRASLAAVSATQDCLVRAGLAPHAPPVAAVAAHRRE